MSTLLIFAATFVAVFTLGLQSLNVNQGMRLMATVTSLAISTGHIFLYKYMPNSGVIDYLGYYAGGITGINASMSAHPYLRAWLERRRRRADEHCDVGECGRIRGEDVH